MLTASADATMKLWAIGDYSCIKTFEGHTNSVLKALFISRGMQIASRYVSVHVHCTINTHYRTCKFYNIQVYIIGWLFVFVPFQIRGWKLFHLVVGIIHT